MAKRKPSRKATPLDLRSDWDGDFKPPTLGKAIRMGRLFNDLSIRALAKRAGLSPAQVSRIEAEQVQQPARETVVALGRALNFDPVPLLALAGHLDTERTATWLMQAAKRAGADTAKWLAEELRGPLDEPHVRYLAMAILSASDPVADWSDVWFNALEDTWGEASEDPALDELRALLPRLNEPRRQLLLQLARDQAALSDLERKKRGSS